MVKENMINPEMKVREREGKRLLTLGFEGDLGGFVLYYNNDIQREKMEKADLRDFVVCYESNLYGDFITNLSFLFNYFLVLD